jgi:hypothetical protein
MISTVSVRSFFARVVVIATIGAIAGACSEKSIPDEADSENSTTIRLPVLTFCSTGLPESLENAFAGLDVAGRYVTFDDSLRSLPQLAGYVELSSQRRSRESLLALGRGVIDGCQLDYEISFDKTNSNLGVSLFGFLSEAESGNMKWDSLDGKIGSVVPASITIINDNGQVRVLFHVSY